MAANGPSELGSNSLQFPSAHMALNFVAPAGNWEPGTGCGIEFVAVKIVAQCGQPGMVGFLLVQQPGAGCGQPGTRRGRTGEAAGGFWCGDATRVVAPLVRDRSRSPPYGVCLWEALLLPGTARQLEMFSFMGTTLGCHDEMTMLVRAAKLFKSWTDSFVQGGFNEAPEHRC